MNKMILHKLETLKEFQAKYPLSHVGGSIGLMIRGVDLKRALYDSDLDITVDVFNEITIKDNGLEARSDGNDFDFCFKKNHSDGLYTKIDIRIDPKSFFDIVEFEGENYNVSILSDILSWKKRYAEKGVLKHKFDIIAIETGVRPPEPQDDFDDLPY
jgi:hypothetical protein